ncbi:MAG: hypothetical protein RJB25_1518, partial [Bacteroidota bacterium]
EAQQKLDVVADRAFINAFLDCGIVCGIASEENDEFVAFDRHSPADVNGSCPLPLYPDEQNFLQLIDSCNNAVFSLYDGSPVSNSIYGLRQYATQFNGTNLLRVYN